MRNELRDAVTQGDSKRLVRLAQEPEIPPAATCDLLARSLALLGRPDEALEFLRRAYRKYPGDFWIHSGLGYLLGRAGTRHWEEALRHRMAAAALRPSWASIYGLATIYWRMRRWDDAERRYAEAIGYPDAGVIAYGEHGFSALQREEFPEAERRFRLALDRDDTYGRGHMGLGSALYGQRRYTDALVHYRLSVKYAPGVLAHHYNRALCLLMLKDEDAALNAAHQAVGLHRDWPELSAMSAALLTAPKVRDAASRLSPDPNRPAPFTLSMALWHLDRKADARAWYGEITRFLKGRSDLREQYERFRVEADAVMR